MHAFVAASHDKAPNGCRGNGDRYPARYPNISMPEATPANSEKVVATLPDEESQHGKCRKADAEAFTDQRRKALAGNNAHARCRGLHHDKQNAHNRNDPQRHVAEFGTYGGIG